MDNNRPSVVIGTRDKKLSRCWQTRATR